MVSVNQITYVFISSVSAYQLYLAMMKVKQDKDSDLEATEKLCGQFLRTLCYKGVTVHFVGVW